MKSSPDSPARVGRLEWPRLLAIRRCCADWPCDSRPEQRDRRGNAAPVIQPPRTEPLARAPSSRCECDISASVGVRAARVEAPSPAGPLRDSVPRKAHQRVGKRERGSGRFVAAGPGWGKTTLLAEWAAGSERPFAWVDVDETDNDPIVLLSYIAVALDRVAPLDPRVFDSLASPGASVEATVVPRLGAAMATIGRPVVLVLDDLHLVDNPACPRRRRSTRETRAGRLTARSLRARRCNPAGSTARARPRNRDRAG